MNVQTAIMIAATDRDGYFLTSATLPRLISCDRLHPVLIRAGSCRLECPAQDAAHIMECLKAGGDYVRDVGFRAVDVDLAKRLLGVRDDRQTMRAAFVETLQESNRRNPWPAQMRRGNRCIEPEISDAAPGL